MAISNSKNTTSLIDLEGIFMIQNKTYFSHPSAIIEPGAEIGEKTRVWAFAHILPGAKIGNDCNICDHVFIENDVVVGDRVTIKSGVQLWDGVRLENDVFIGPNVTFTNDPFPRSKQHPEKYLSTIIRKGASVGANATILPGVIIGENSMVGSGSVVTGNVPQNAIVFGNPARIEGYVSSKTRRPIEKSSLSLDSDVSFTKVSGVNIIQLPKITDIRGDLSFGEFDKHLPFLPKRYFIIYGVPTKEVRGEHAHKQTHQFLICIQGSVHVVVDNGTVQDEIILEKSHIGLHIPPLVWSIQYHYSSDAILLVLASEVYDAEDYIRDHDIYLEVIYSLKS